MKNVFKLPVILFSLVVFIAGCTPPGGPVPPHENYVKFKMDGVQHYSNWNDGGYSHQMHFSDPSNFSNFYFYDAWPNHFGAVIVIDGNQ